MKKDLTKKSSYYYDLPEELIAQYPLQKRDESRLLYLNKKSGKVEHYIFSDLPNLLNSDDVLVINKTKVIPARLKGKKKNGVNAEIFLLNQIENDVWECLVKPGRRLKPGTKVYFSHNFSAEIIDYAQEGARIVNFIFKMTFGKR
jgi:S-adenosylmethionine:tRNA ribosyltransferase-isomerase